MNELKLISMNVLWITTTPLPEAKSLLNGEASDRIKSTGSWIQALADSFCDISEINLSIATPTSLVSELKFLQGRNIQYILFPAGNGVTKMTGEYDEYWKLIKKSVYPDIIHIHGTEYAQGLNYVNCMRNDNVVVSIQGIISEISKPKYYYADLDWWTIFRNLTIRDILAKDSVFASRKEMEIRSTNEKQLLQSVKHVIGRTQWDKAHVLSINNKLNYHFCNENVRSDFFDGRWIYEKCVPHRIFLSQAHCPLKGAHKLLLVLPKLRQRYPDVQVFIAGASPVREDKYGGILPKMGGYGKILNGIIHKYSLQDIVSFTGPLDATQMKRELLMSNVFVCPSSVENSPNSLGEAQLLGVPCIGSFVGGIPDMIPSKDCGWLYRFEDEDMLFDCICKCFDNSSSFDNSHEIEVARDRHNATNNLSQLLSIYKSIAK